MTTGRLNAPTALTVSARIQRDAIVGLMLVTTLALVVGNPLLCLWLASVVANTSAPALGPYVVVIVGLVGGTFALGFVLAVLAHAYNRIVGAEPHSRRRTADNWDAARHDDPGRHVVAAVVVAGLGIAAAGACVWFLFFAGSSLG